MTFGEYFVALSGTLLLTVFCLGVYLAMRSKSLPRNALLGIRTKHTTANDAAWDAAHQAAMPQTLGVVIAGVLVLIGATVFFLAYDASTTGVPDWGIAVPLVGLLVQSGILLWACVVANNAAKKVLGV